MSACHGCVGWPASVARGDDTVLKSVPIGFVRILRTYDSNMAKLTYISEFRFNYPTKR